jgi:hypothetical protein
MIKLQPIPVRRQPPPLTPGSSRDTAGRVEPGAGPGGGHRTHRALLARRISREAPDGIDKAISYLSSTELSHTVRLFSITNKPPIPIPGVATCSLSFELVSCHNRFFIVP